MENSIKSVSYIFNGQTKIKQITANKIMQTEE